MNVLPKVLGMTVAGVLVIVLYLLPSIVGAVVGGVATPSGASPTGFFVYIGLALTAVILSTIMYLASTGGAED